MARTNLFPTKATSSTKQLAIGLWDSAASLLAMCSKHTSQAARKLRSQPSFARVAPRQLLTVISNKVVRFRHKKRGEKFDSEDGDEFGLWQRSILMGEKCEPLDFSGVIYYDSNGKQLEELPMRSPRAGPLPNFLCNSVERSK